MSNVIHADLAAVFDMQRAEDWAEAKTRSWYRAEQTRAVRLEDGPCDGWTGEYELAPDYFTATGGRYFPLMASPRRYVWIPDDAEAAMSFPSWAYLTNPRTRVLK